MSNSSKFGKLYELEIYNILNRCKINDVPFNEQDSNDLGGNTTKNDIEFKFNDKVYDIEIKKYKSPDWTQCVIRYDKDSGKWFIPDENKLAPGSRDVFRELIKDYTPFGGKVPPFVYNKITHVEWLNVKKDFKDEYLDCPEDTINKLYLNKNCKYIQISNKGLYHLGEDVCGFGVPLFKCEQIIRIRTKIHSRKNKQGFCNLSVTISCKPKSKYMLKKVFIR